MAKRKKSSDIIQDTTAGEMVLDINAPDEDRTIEGLLRMEKRYTPSDNRTVSWRIPDELFKWAKEIARQQSSKQKKDIHYQKLIMGCFLEKYPLPKEK